ncbi:MAG: DEAD/DEAH box helicase [Colwellia sp.]|nr:DEAD/DEAH box helicase [Colwellia sp.]
MNKTADFIYDAEQLSAVTSEQEYRRGLFYYKENRVFECYKSQNSLFAAVEGNDAEFPYNLTISIKQDKSLEVSCDCANSTEAVCKHAVAALLVYKDDFEQENSQTDFLSLRETAIKDRIKRGQNEVKIEHQDGHPVFGIFKAQTIANNTPWARSYQVQIRSLTNKINYCNCPDLFNNQLGTCKHIEAVLHYLSKQTNTTELLPPLPFIYYDWQSEQKIKLQRTANISETLIDNLQTYFDPQGNFTGTLPNDFFALQDRLFGSNQIVIGDDAKRYVQQLANKQLHVLKAQEINQKIQQLNGNVPGINATLYSYQIEGMAFLAANGRALLADDMGLGKTLQAIAASTWLINHEKVQRVLIVCPASLKQQWAREIEKFSGLSTQIINGNAAKRHPQYNNNATFFIVNYELILRDLTVINDILSPDLIILDEAQRIKNWRTKVASATKLIRSRYAFVLTGTPLENKLEEFYSLMQVVDDNVLGPLWRYISDYHILDERGKVIGYRNLTQLRKIASPVMLRRNRSIVSDQLPDRITTQIDVPMTSKQKELHDGALSAASRLAKIALTRALTPSEQNRMMAALQQARMACNAAGLVDKKTIGSPKLDELRTLVEELAISSERKLVVFSQWKGMTTMVEAMFKDMNIGSVHLHGGIPSHKRGDLIDKFNLDSSIRVFISTDAGGSGLNLQTASVLVNMDLPWNPAILEQRNARIHRLGQKHKVQIMLLIAADSYEQRVLELVTSKQDLFDNVISPEAEQDVVGITKKSLSVVLNELNKEKGAEEEQALDEATEQAIETTTANKALAQIKIPPQFNQHDQQLIETLSLLQQQFGDKIEQVLAKNAGLLIIVDALNDDIEQLVNSLELDFSIAVIDQRTQRQLAKLGLDNPLTNAEPIVLPILEPTLSLWIQQANDKLNSAKFLFEHEQDGVIDLLVTAISACITELAQQAQLINAEEVPVWLFSQGVPNKKITDTQATTMIRTLSLKHATHIPRTLQQQALDDIQALLAEMW